MSNFSMKQNHCMHDKMLGPPPGNNCSGEEVNTYEGEQISFSKMIKLYNLLSNYIFS